MGWYTDSKVAYHGFLLRQGKYTTLNHPKAPNSQWFGTMPGGINRNGDVVGAYLDSKRVRHGFLWR